MTLTALLEAQSRADRGGGPRRRWPATSAAARATRRSSTRCWRCERGDRPLRPPCRRRGQGHRRGDLHASTASCRGCCTRKLLRSPVAAGRITRLDTDQGARAARRAGDRHRGRRARALGHVHQGPAAVRDGAVRYIGEPVAAVAADTRSRRRAPRSRRSSSRSRPAPAVTEIDDRDRRRRAARARALGVVRLRARRRARRQSPVGGRAADGDVDGRVRPRRRHRASRTSSQCRASTRATSSRAAPSRASRPGRYVVHT